MKSPNLEISRDGRIRIHVPMQLKHKEGRKWPGNCFINSLKTKFPGSKNSLPMTGNNTPASRESHWYG